MRPEIYVWRKGGLRHEHDTLCGRTDRTWREKLRYFFKAFIRPDHISGGRDKRYLRRTCGGADAVLESQDPEKDVQLYLNSPGGSITAGFAIYDTMRFIKCDVAVTCIGLAASFGAFLLAGGTKGKRSALPDAEIMIHQPAIHGNGIQGQATDIHIVSEHMQRNRERLNRILAENTGKTAGQIAVDTERDYYMSAQEALEYGIIDHIIQAKR